MQSNYMKDWRVKIRLQHSQITPIFPVFCVHSRDALDIVRGQLLQEGMRVSHKDMLVWRANKPEKFFEPKVVKHEPA